MGQLIPPMVKVPEKVYNGLLECYQRDLIDSWISDEKDLDKISHDLTIVYLELEDSDVSKAWLQAIRDYYWEATKPKMPPNRTAVR